MVLKTTPSNSPARKRQRLEDLEPSQTVGKLVELVGRGKISVSSACDLAGDIVKDHPIPNAAVKVFSSLGGHGQHPQNAERDMHRWLKKLYGLNLQTYVINVELQVDSQKAQNIPIRVLLPHEIFHAISTMESQFFFRSVFLGNLSDEERQNFWRHIKDLPPWSDHPVLNRGADLKRLVGVTIHGDGAVMKRDDECFVWSVSSCFGHEGIIKDCLHLKFPVAIIPERHMLSKEDPQLHALAYALNPTVCYVVMGLLTNVSQSITAST